MFYDPTMMKEVYSKYLNGMDIEDIVYSTSWLSDNGIDVGDEEVEEIIDIMNRIYM